MATKQKGQIDVAIYKTFLKENKMLWDLLDVAKKKFKFPIENVLEVGSGLANYLTKFLIDSERAKKVDKFYAMEPVEELFEESKRSVVRLSRTDATIHEYYGGNPFQMVTYAFVTNHITPDRKQKLLDNISNNLDDEGAFLAIDTFVPDYKDEDGRKKSIEKYLQAHLDYAKQIKNKFLIKYYEDVIAGKESDIFGGDYKVSCSQFKTWLENAGFTNIKATLYKPNDKANWKNMGYYVVTAQRE